MTRRSFVFRELARRIDGSIEDLDSVSNRVASTWSRAAKSDFDQDVMKDSVALNLHGFYSGVERIFELIAQQIDLAMPTGDTWHRDLLAQMTQPIADVRPAIISEASHQFLDEMRRFRHLVRNVYTFNLNPDKISPLADALAHSWPLLRLELQAFGGFLIALADISEASDT